MSFIQGLTAMWLMVPHNAHIYRIHHLCSDRHECEITAKRSKSKASLKNKIKTPADSTEPALQRNYGSYDQLSLQETLQLQIRF